MGLAALIPVGLSIYNAIAGSSKAKKEQKLRNEALALRQREYAERAPFRQFALKGLGQMGQPIQSGSLFQNRANPFSRGRDYSMDLGAQMRAPALAPTAPAPMAVGGGGGGGGGGAMMGFDPYTMTPLGGRDAFV